ncbi:unnamed protein product [Moneuplotes crassus]|uniref:Uncharacterized protein n=1 Tax=Euplotes crassus TaxID=5936 RepID=A0AAD1XE32_EUPCR|nr:unnamed protein product [Moneuplotes crassus]
MLYYGTNIFYPYTLVTSYYLFIFMLFIPLIPVIVFYFFLCFLISVCKIPVDCYLGVFGSPVTNFDEFHSIRLDGRIHPVDIMPQVPHIPIPNQSEMIKFSASKLKFDF